MAVTANLAPAMTRTVRVGRFARIFSFPMMCMFLLAAVIFAFCVKQFAEPDMWWHMRYARDLLQNHSFPVVDTYSFTAAGSYRPNFEWLSEVPFFLAFKTMGLRGILALYFGILVLIYSGVYYRSCKEGADCKNAAITTLIGISLGVVSIGPRTLLFGWLCMIGLLLVLDRFRQTGKGLWLLPPLFALWINLHPSWMFGLIVVGLVLASGLVEGEWGLVVAHKWSSAQLTSLVGAFAASVAALFVNPFGYKLIVFPFKSLFRLQGNVQYVEEWRGIDFSTGNGKLALFVILGLLTAITFSRRRWRLDEVFLMALALGAALLHGRFLFFAGLILPPMLAQRLSLFPPYDRELDKPWLNAAIMAVVFAALIFFFPPNAALQQKVGEEYPDAALRFMQRQHLAGRTFNQYVWGGYMEWNAPELKTFIDGRADIFADNGVLNDHRKANDIDRPLEIMDKYGIDYVLLQPQRPLAYLLEHSPGWELAYADNVAVLYERTPVTAAAASPALN